MDKRGLSIISAILFLLILLPFSVEGQTIQQGQTRQGVQQQSDINKSDTTQVLIVRRSIFDILAEQGYGNGSVQIIQDNSIDILMNRYMAKAAERKLRGYRIRIFYSNVQTARETSLEVEKQFREKYPNIAVYRTSEESNFRVTVGDFRTKSEAEKFKREIEKDFAIIFIIREESINFPPL